MTDSSKLIRAAVFAADAHREQRRKGRKKTPYINHPLGVAAVLSVEASVHDTNLLMAALLHDTVEDTETSFDDLEETFGPVIASLVREVSDDKSRTKAERKRLQVKHAADASEGAKQVKIADKICNIRDIAYDPPSDWSHERRLEYLDWAEEVVVACRGVNEELDALFNVVITDARRTVNREDP